MGSRANLSQDDAVSGRVPTGLNAPGLERAERRGIFFYMVYST